MVYKCAICMRDNTKNKIAFFRFPTTEPIILPQWIKAVNKENWTLTTSSRVCQLHFKNTDFTNASKILRLKKDVIPSQNLNNESIENNHALDLYADSNVCADSNVENPTLRTDCVCNIGTSELNEAELSNTSNVMTNTDSTIVEKRKAVEPLEEADINKYRKLEEENKKLKVTIKSLTQKYEEKLNNQADMFRILIEKEKNVLKEKLSAEKNKFLYLQKKSNRKEEKLETVMQELKKCKMLSNETYNLLSSDMSSVSSQLFENEYKNQKKDKKGRRYSDDIKRTVFKLPHQSSLRNWMSNVNAEPGFQLKVLEALSKLDEKEKDCCLIFDCMAIRQQITWSEGEHKYIGFCDYGNFVCIEHKDIEAQEALVFLLVSLKGAWKWPIAYFLIKRISSKILAELIRNALIICSEHNLRVHSVTFDGDASNCSAVNILGANIFHNDYTQIKHFFPCPNNENKNIKVILDPCHMLKLARNALADYKQFESVEGSIKWDYIIKLHTLQKQLTFKLKNRLSSQSVNWKQNKMKVKFAAHVLSASVANAIEFLEREGFDEFYGSSATVKFLRTIDRLFDILNSRNPFGKGFKTPIFEKNIEYLKHKTDDIIKYLFSLKTIEGKSLYCTGRKTFIYGFCIAARSILDISQEILKNNESFKYILAYKFSQDHLEIFFSKIRGRHGFNNNPTCHQFKCAVRQILLHADIKHSINSNCFEFDTEYATSIFPLMWKKKKEDNLFNDLENTDDKFNDDFEEIPLQKHDTITDNIIYYISGYIVKNFKYLNCDSCALNLRNMSSDHNYYSHEETFSRFFNFCNNGGLVQPSSSVFYICKETEKQLQIVTNYFSQIHIKNIDKKVINEVKNILTFDNKIFPNLQCENVSLTEMPHKIRLIITICNKYLKVRLHSYSKFYQTEILKSIRKRHILTKQILFLRE